MNSRVLVGIVTCNRADILPKAIQSALEQTFPALEVAVIDDGSRDATPTVSSQFPEVTWKRRDKSEGYMSARNEFMERSGFSYFVSLDDDAWFLKGDEIQVAINYLESHPEVGALGFDILSPDRPDTRERSAPIPAAMFIGCGHVVRLSALDSVGMYDPVPGGYGGEEKDLCLRLLDAGFHVVTLPGVHVWHDKTPVARELYKQHRSGVCNDLAMTLRRTPAFALPIALPMKFLRHLQFAWSRGLIKPCLRGFALFIRNSPSLWKSRRPLRLDTLKAFVRLSRG